MRINRLGAFTLGVVITAVSVGAVSFVNAAGDAKLKACANKTSGAMRYISKGKCKKTETLLSWNQRGSQGLSGTPGTNGIAGTKGDQGATGAKGDQGATGAKGDQGSKGDQGTTGAKITELSICGNDGATLCTIGSKGPGGGFIFFIDYFDQYPTFNYLEAAIGDAVFGDSVFSPSGPWSTTTTGCGSSLDGDCQLNSIYSETSFTLSVLKGSHRGIFGGEAATLRIVDRHGLVSKKTYAAGVANAYISPLHLGQSKDDWYLPSRSELFLMQSNLNEAGISYFRQDFYWSSSEQSSPIAWGEDFDFGASGSFNWKAKNGDGYVRPVRSF